MVKTNSSVFQPNYFMQWSCVHNIWFPAASLHNLPWCSSCLYLPYCDINLSAVFKVCYQQWSMTASHKQVRRFALLFSLMSWLKGLFPYLERSKSDSVPFTPFCCFYSSAAFDWKSYGILSGSNSVWLVS